MPRPVRRILSPFLRCLVASVIRSPTTASACFFDNSWLSANSAAICLSVTVAGDIALSDGMTNSSNQLRYEHLPALAGFEQISHAPRLRRTPHRRVPQGVARIRSRTDGLHEEHRDIQP